MNPIFWLNRDKKVRQCFLFWLILILHIAIKKRQAVARNLFRIKKDRKRFWFCIWLAKQKRVSGIYSKPRNWIIIVFHSSLIPMAAKKVTTRRTTDTMVHFIAYILANMFYDLFFHLYMSPNSHMTTCSIQASFLILIPRNYNDRENCHKKLLF